MKERRAIFAVLDYQCLRPERHHRACGLDKVFIGGQHLRLGFVDEQNVQAFEDFEQRRAMILNPVVHGVAGGELHIGQGIADSFL